MKFIVVKEEERFFPLEGTYYLKRNFWDGYKIIALIKWSEP
jgi:hypothetical protein